MASENRVRGARSVLKIVENSMKEGKHYEAHQIYKAMILRHSQRRYTELLDMLHNGALLFLAYDQQMTAAVLGIRLVEVLVQSENKNYTDWMDKLIKIFEQLNATPERDTFIGKCIQWSSNPVLHQKIAEIYWKEKNYSRARYHYQYSEDGEGCARLLIDLQAQQGYKCDADLYVAETVLQFLCLKNTCTAQRAFDCYTSHHPNVKRSRLTFFYPLINFIWFLLQLLEQPEASKYKVLCKEYEPYIKKVPCYEQQLDKIGQIFFGLPPCSAGRECDDEATSGPNPKENAGLN